MNRQDAYSFVKSYAAFMASPASKSVKILDLDPVNEMVEIQVAPATPAELPIRMWASYWDAAKLIEAESCSVALDEDLVAHGEGCPNCGEERVDYLVWTEDSETVLCVSCDTRYDPDQDR